MKKNILNLVIAGAVLLLLSCAPRGETNEMGDILAEARTRYRIADQKFANQAIQKQLGQVTEKLASIEKVQDPAVIKLTTAELSTLLTSVLPHVGYTVRPALAELIAQYRQLGEGAKVTTDSSLAGAPEIRLLLTRTYTVLASELETGKFAL